MKKLWIGVGIAVLSIVGLVITLAGSASVKCRFTTGLEWLSCILS